MISNQINNQNNFIARTRQLTRRCSYCRNQGHIITTCNDERLINFQTTLINRRDELREVPSIDLNNKISYFQTWLCSQDNNLIKSFAMRFCGAYTRNNLELCIQKIINYIWDTEQTPFGFLAPLHEYIPLPAISIMDIPDQFDYINLTEFLADMINVNNMNEEPIQNRKYKINPILCLDAEGLDIEEDCNICFEKTKFRNMITLNCNHKFCGDCVSQTFKKCNKFKLPNCAMCRTKTDWLLVNDQKILDKLKENIL